MNKHPILRRIARIAIWLLAGIFFLSVIGVIYQAIATQLDERKYPAPGQLVDIGGYRLHVNCAGEGSPTVLLDAAADMMSSDWIWIQSEIAKQNQVCSYDRAGMGWSDAGPLPRDAKQITSELHLLLQNAKISGPFVIVGHSAGGLYAQLYAATYPNEVVGLVLVDPGHPDMKTRIPALQSQDESDAGLVGAMRVLSYFGIPRLMKVGNGNAQGLPEQQVAEVNAFAANPKQWATILNLIKASSATDDELRATGSLGNKPEVVVSANTAWFVKGAPADEARQTLNSLHEELAQLSSNSSHRIVDGATHASLVHDSDDALEVIKAIQDVLASLQTGQPVNS